MDRVSISWTEGATRLARRLRTLCAWPLLFCILRGGIASSTSAAAQERFRYVVEHGEDEAGRFLFEALADVMYTWPLTSAGLPIGIVSMVGSLIVLVVDSDSWL